MQSRLILEPARFHPTQVAPGISLCSSFISRAECENLTKWLSTEPSWVQAEAGRYANNELLSSKVDRTLRDVEVSRESLPPHLESRLQIETVEKHARAFYGIDNLRASRYVLSKYQPGCHIRPHSDTTFSSTTRIATCVQYFNEDFGGGSIYFPQFNISITPTTGAMLLFFSEYLHGVDEIIWGTRYCSVLFLEHFS